MPEKSMVLRRGFKRNKKGQLTRGRWDFGDDGCFYMVCRKCRTVLKFKSKVYDDGSVSPCVHCWKCDVHWWVVLDGWIDFKSSKKRLSSMTLDQRRESIFGDETQ